MPTRGHWISTAARGTEVVHVAGYGTDSRGEPLTADTPMGVASVSKSFTALSVMWLVEDGAIGLDDPVVDHLPEFTTADGRRRSTSFPP